MDEKQGSSKAKRVREFHELGDQTLKERWSSVQGLPLDRDIIDSEDIVALVRELTRADIMSYRYVLPTQLLAKVVDNKLDSRCVQVRRGLGPENFDARSVAHKIIVPFDKENNSPLGGSPAPYLNNPLRVLEISAKHRDAQKNQEEWDKLCLVLETVENKQDPEFTSELFDQVLLEIRRVQNELKIEYPIPLRNNLEDVIEIVRKYLAVASGGSRLQAVSFAIFKTFQDRWGIYDEIVSAPVTVTDVSGNRPADIVCRKNGKIVLAVEIKDQTVTMQLLIDKINSARIAKVSELMFLIGTSKIVENDAVFNKARSEFSSGLNIYLFEAIPFYTTALGLFGEEGRRVFFEQIGHALDELKLTFKDKKDWENLLKTEL